MSFKKIAEKWDMRFLLRALAAWAATAAVLLLLAALIASKCNAGSRGMAYLSSGISFLAAVSAGFYGSRGRNTGSLYAGLLTAVFLCVVLLTAGFLIKGAEIESAGVLSVVTFSFSGCLVGSVLPGGGKGRSKKKPFGLKGRR